MSRVIGAIAGLMLLANVAAADVVVGNSVISQNTISLGVYELAVSSNGTIVVEDSTSTNAEPPIAYATEEWVAANGFVANVVVGGTNYLTDAGSITLPEIAGPQGIQGIQGIQGPAGTNGVDGAQGIQGIQGHAGTNGVDGAQGIQGEQGPAGTNGVDGAQGIQGIQGPAGTNGVDGAQGIQGEQGPAGTNGVDGAQGPQGIQGEQGVQGPAGTNGVDGAQGIQGEVGPMGPAGTNGLDGAQGPAGTNGIDGVQGPQGIQGIQGIQGPAGTNGIDGLGWTGGSYEATNGVVTFTSEDGLGFSTGDLRGAQGIQGPAGPTNYGITSTNSYRGDWGQAASNLASTAYGWGNHSTNGYATTSWVGLQGYLTNQQYAVVTAGSNVTVQAVTNGEVVSYAVTASGSGGNVFLANDNLFTGSNTFNSEIEMAGDVAINFGDSGRVKGNSGTFSLLDFNGMYALTYNGTGRSMYSTNNTQVLSIGDNLPPTLISGDGIWKSEGNATNGTEIVNYQTMTNHIASQIAYDVVPASSNAYSLGSPDKPWADLYLGTNSLHIGSVVLSSSDRGLQITAGTNAPAPIASAPLVASLAYSGTNVVSDFNLAQSFRVTLTNNAHLAAPSNVADGQIVKWWFRQGIGNNTLTIDPTYKLPSGTTSLVLSTNVNANDHLIGVYDASTTNVYLTGLLLFE